MSADVEFYDNAPARDMVDPEMIVWLNIDLYWLALLIHEDIASIFE